MGVSSLEVGSSADRGAASSGRGKSIIGDVATKEVGEVALGGATEISHDEDDAENMDPRWSELKKLKTIIKD